MKHRFNDAHADGADATIVRPSNWNDTHVHGVTSISVNTAGATTDDLVLATGGAGGITYTLPAPSNTGQPIKIMKVDSASGAVTINRNATEKINSLNLLNGTSYVLSNPGQYVELVSDGTNWWVTDAN